MADCKIEKNKKNGKINKVLDVAGNKSTLFQELLNVPTLSLNEAIDAYKNIYSEQLKDKIILEEYSKVNNITMEQALDLTKMTETVYQNIANRLGKTVDELKRSMAVRTVPNVQQFLKDVPNSISSLFGLSSEIVNNFSNTTVEDINIAFQSVQQKYQKNLGLSEKDFIMSNLLDMEDSFSFLGFSQKLSGLGSKQKITEEINKRLLQIRDKAINSNEFYIQELSESFLKSSLKRATTESEKESIQVLIDGNEQAIKQNIENLQGQQRANLLGSLDYLIPSSDYSAEFKYMMVGMILKGNQAKDIQVLDDNGNLKQTIKGEKAKRNSQTVGNHQELSSMVLPNVYQEMLQGSEQHPMKLIDKHTDKSYITREETWEIIKDRVVKEQDGGYWVKFDKSNKGEDVRALTLVSKKVAKVMQSNPWCTGGGMASSYLPKGDFYLFLDKELEPKITVRYEGDAVREVKGTDSGQALSKEQTSNVEKYLPSLSNGAIYINQVKASKVYHRLKERSEQGSTKDTFESKEELQDYFDVYGVQLETYDNKKLEESFRLKDFAFNDAIRANERYNLYTKITKGRDINESYTLTSGECVLGDVYMTDMSINNSFIIPKGVIFNGDFYIDQSHFKEGLTISQDVIFNGKFSAYRTFFYKGLVISKNVVFSEEFNLMRALPNKLTILNNVVFNKRVEAYESEYREGITISKGVVFNDYVDFGQISASKIDIDNNVIFKNSFGFSGKLPDNFVRPIIETPTRVAQQDNRGAILQTDKSTLILLDKNNADITTPIHELAHKFEDVLTKEEVKTIEDWSGHKKGTKEFREAFAIGAEKYIYEGANLNSKIDGIFERFKQWFKDAIQNAIEYFGSINNLNEEVKDIYARIFNEQDSDIRYQIIGEKGAQNLDQIEEATFRMDNLKVAREMEAAGKTPKEIRLASGWERGADKEWGYEILDGELLITLEQLKTTEGSFKLSEIYNNNELFSSYSDLKDIEVVITKGYETYIYAADNTIFIGRQNKTKFTSLLLHELQHAIQKNEGFSQGGSSYTFEDFQDTKKQVIIDNFNKNKVAFINSLGLKKKATEEWIKDAAEPITLLNYREQRNSNRIFNLYTYMALAGEVQARNVQSRMNMSAEQRRQTLLEETEDVAREDQIFLMDNLGGSQMSFSPQKSSERITQEIIDKLKQNGLSEDVFLLSTEEINAKLIELGVEADVRRQVEAWHGSPYSFDRFTTNAMGTGEGVQAFGWGLYFTDLESIARNYAETLGGVDAKIYANGKEVGYGHPLFNYQSFFTKSNSDANSVLIELKEFQKLEEGFPENSTTKARKKAIAFLEKSPKIKVEANRNLYKVSLHKGKTPSEYTWLEWDREVPKNLVSNIRELEKELFDIIGTNLDSSGNKIDIIEGTYGKSGEGVYDRFEPEDDDGNFIDWLGQNVYQNLDNILFDSKQASLLLLKYGIDGVKYPAESISRGATSDTARGFNYVVFDENAITIEEQIQFQKALNNVGINLITNGLTYKDSKTGKDIVILNKDTADDSTSIHEFSHIFSKWQKENRPELWKKGQDLVKAEIGKQKEKLSKKDNKELKKLLDFKTDSVTIYDENATAEILIEQLSDGEVSLNISEIWSDIKGQGSATKLLNKIQSFSDEYNVAISLRASTNNNIRTSGGLEQDALVKWYEKNGFSISEEDNNFETDETAPFMVYQPTIAAKSEIQEIVDYVKQTQPKLKEGSEAYFDEILQEYISRESKNMMDEQKAKSPLMQWLSDFWEEIRKMLSLTSMTPEQVANLSLRDFARASVVDLLKGEYIGKSNLDGGINRQIIGEKGASRVEEYQQSLNQAKELEKRGKDYTQTGWFKNEQGQWKYFSNEILNEFLDFPQIKNKTVNLKDLLKEDSILLKAYPQLNNVKVEFYEGTKGADFRRDGQVNGTVTKTGDKITIHARTDQTDGGNSVSTIGHEVAHLLQSLEGFARGGSPNAFVKIASQIAGVKETDSEAVAREKINSLDVSTLNKDEKRIVSIVRDVIKTNSVKLLKDSYYLLQGEIDARAVELALELKQTTNTNIAFNYSSLVKKLGQVEGIDVVNQAINIFIDDINLSKAQNKQTVKEPKATFNGFNTYSEAVKNTPINDPIKIDIEGINIGEVTNNGDINDLIRQDIIVDERELTPSGDIVFVTKGNSLTKKLINAEIASETIKGRINEEGNIVEREKVDLTKVSEDFNKNKKEFGESIALTILGSQILAKYTPTFGNNRIVDFSVDVPTETVLMEKLKNLMQQLGIKTMSIESWEKNFEKRTGKKPTANSLADISGKIIAFSNGEITQDMLTEEVMHFVVEALPQEEIQPLLDMIHKTDEWKEYAQQYSEIYQNDDTVRREVLGKVLKNRIQGKAEQSTLQGQSITRRLAEIIGRFFEKVRGLLKPQHLQQIDKFTDEIYKRLMADELYSDLSPEQFEGNNLVMYQTSADPIYDHLSDTIDKFEKLDRETGRQNKFELTLLDIENRNEAHQLRTVSALSSMIKTKVKYLTKRGKQGGFLSMEEQSVYDVAINELAPTLGKLKNIVAEKVTINSTLKQMVIEQATEAITSLSELTTALNEDNDRVFETLVEDVALQTGLTPEMTEVLKKEMKTIQRDTNQFFSLYGSLSQAQNPILNLLSVVISDAERESVIQFDRRQSEFINQAKAIGFSDEEIAGKLKEFKDGYYFISEYDFPEIERQEAIFKAEVYNSITGGKLSAEELLEDESNLIKKLPKKSQTTYNFKVKERKDKSGMYLDRLTKEERKKADELIEGFSEKTKLFLANQAKRKGEIMQRIRINRGASMEDNFLLKDIAKERQQMSNPYDENGYLYKGLTMDSEGNLTLNEKFKELTNDSDKERVMTILELANYNKKIVKQYKEKERLNGKQTVPQSFIDKIQELRGSGDFESVKKATEFLRLNTRISYNGDFWDSFEKTNGLVEKLRETLDKEAIKIADDIARERSRLKNILKEHRDYNNPSQIDYENLGGAENTIKDIMDSLEYNYEKAKSHLKEEKTDKKESSSESITNDAYKKVIEDRGLKVTDRKSYEEKLSFILRHVTPKNRKKIEKTAENFIRYKKGVYDTVPKGFENFYNESQNIKEFKDNVEVYNDIISYAESMLLPYFKELKPVDFNMNQFIGQLVSAKTEAEFNRIIEETKYLSVTPSYALIDAEDNNRLNPEYTEAFEAGNPTINLDFKDKNGNKILKNKRYAEMFLDANGKIRKEKEKDKQLLDLAISFWADSIKSAGMEGKHSKYQLPGIRRNSLARKEQLIKNFSVKNLKESIKDIITVREDDPIFGQASDIGARGSLKVPRIGFSKLESADEVTDEILYSLMHTANQAEKRKQRVASLHKVEAVKTRLRGASYGDKSGESTTAYKMADDFTRYNIYGQTETFKWETDFFGLTSKKYNLAPVIKHFQGWARLVGIGFSTLVPLTSFLQGSINFFVENIVGDRINPTASKLASKKAGQLLTRAIKEEFMSEIKTKSELNLLMQFFGLANPIDNFKNTNSGRVLRGLAPENSAYFSHYMGDVPLTAQTLMTVLYDFKVVEDAKTKEMKLQSYSEWRNDNRALVITTGAAPVTESQALSEWKLNQNYLYNYIEIDKNAVGDISGMKMNDEYYKIFAGKEKYATERLNFVKRKIQTTKQEIDNQIPNEDKANIQRHAIFSFVSMFKGFLITSINKRLKMRHDSFHTNEMEEGTYRGTSEFLAALINKGKKNKDGKRQSFKDFWKEQYRAFDGGYKLVKEGDEWNVYNTNKEGNPKVFSSQDENSAKSAHAQLQVRATQMRQTSLKRAGMDLAVTTALATIALIAKQMADDDDDDYVSEFIAYMTYRVAVETTSQSTGLPGQIYSFLQSPTAGLSQVNNLINIGDVFSGDVVKQGTYRGYTEREAWMYRSLPIMKEYFRLKEIDRSRQDYKKYNKHFIDNFNMAALMFDEESRK